MVVQNGSRDVLGPEHPKCPSISRGELNGAVPFVRLVLLGADRGLAACSAQIVTSRVSSQSRPGLVFGGVFETF